ncbi:MAG: MATE family efflux transporter [Pseudomonadota bacterium]
MTTDKINEPQDTSLRSIWRLTWPQMLMMLFHFLIGFTDVWVAGRIDANVQASFGIVTQCMFFLLVVATAMASGAVASISQALGACKYQRARRYILLITYAGFAAGLIIASIGLLFREPFLRLLMVPEDILPVAVYFWAVYLLALPANYLVTVSNAAFRASKRVMSPLCTMVLICAINATSSLGFGLGLWGLPNYGFAGVAWSTFFSLTAGAIFNIAMLYRCSLKDCSFLLPWRWVRSGAPYLIKVAMPAAGMQVMWQSGYLVLFAIVGSLPKPADSVVALAGLTAGMRIESLLFLPAMAFSMTASILVGHFLGAEQKLEAKRVGLRILLVGVSSMTVFAACMWPWVPEISAFLAPDPAVTAVTVRYLYINLLTIPFTIASMTLSGIMTGAGATIYTFMVYTSATWFIRLPCAWFLGHILWKDVEGVFIAMLISQVLQSTTMLWMFHYKDWTKYSMASAKHKNRSL